MQLRVECRSVRGVISDSDVKEEAQETDLRSILRYTTACGFVCDPIPTSVSPGRVKCDSSKGVPHVRWISAEPVLQMCVLVHKIINTTNLKLMSVIQYVHRPIQSAAR